MNQPSLDLIVTLKGSEATLHTLQNKLWSTNFDQAILCDALEASVRQTLIAAGITDNLDIEFHCGQIKGRYDTGGGLNANEWLQTKTSS